MPPIDPNRQAAEVGVDGEAKGGAGESEKGGEPPACAAGKSTQGSDRPVQSMNCSVLGRTDFLSTPESTP